MLDLDNVSLCRAWLREHAPPGGTALCIRSLCDRMLTDTGLVGDWLAMREALRAEGRKLIWQDGGSKVALK